MSGETITSDVLTNLAKPKTSATLTLRIIKSFEYRTEKSLVLHDVNLEATTVGRLKEIAKETIQTQPAWKPYRTAILDTMKLYTKAHGAKTTNLIINLDRDDWILSDDSKLLIDIGFENETEVSFFNGELYEAFKANPEVCSAPTSTSVVQTYSRLAGEPSSTPVSHKAMVDNGYSSIITAKSLAGDKDVLTVEPDNRKHIETIVVRCKIDENE